MEFKLSEEQIEKANKWMKEREAYAGASGGQFSYVFTPTSMGCIVKITDRTESFDLTDYDKW